MLTYALFLIIAICAFFPRGRKFISSSFNLILDMFGSSSKNEDLGNHYDNLTNETHAYKEIGGMYDHRK